MTLLPTSAWHAEIPEDLAELGCILRDPEWHRPIHTCPECGGSYKGGAKYCSERCRSRAARQRWLANKTRLRTELVTLLTHHVQGTLDLRRPLCRFCTRSDGQHDVYCRVAKAERHGVGCPCYSCRDVRGEREEPEPSPASWTETSPTWQGTLFANAMYRCSVCHRVFPERDIALHYHPGEPGSAYR